MKPEAVIAWDRQGFRLCGPGRVDAGSAERRCRPTAGPAPHAPWQNPFVERFVGSARRECFDHVIAFNEAGVRKLMTVYGSYYEKARTHLALDKDAPVPRRVMPPGEGDIVAILEVGGLHHRYERCAA